jgi:hypothetical protein
MDSVERGVSLHAVLLSRSGWSNNDWGLVVHLKAINGVCHYESKALSEGRLLASTEEHGYRFAGGCVL